MHHAETLIKDEGRMMTVKENVRVALRHCGQMYNGKMERSLRERERERDRERAQEYDKSVREGDSKSALSQHQVMTGHKVLSKLVIERVSVIDSEPRNLHRKVREAINIKL